MQHSPCESMHSVDNPVPAELCDESYELSNELLSGAQDALCGNSRYHEDFAFTEYSEAVDDQDDYDPSCYQEEFSYTENAAGGFEGQIAYEPTCYQELVHDTRYIQGSDMGTDGSLEEAFYAGYSGTPLYAGYSGTPFYAEYSQAPVAEPAMSSDIQNPSDEAIEGDTECNEQAQPGQPDTPHISGIRFDPKAQLDKDIAEARGQLQYLRSCLERNRNVWCSIEDRISREARDLRKLSKELAIRNHTSLRRPRRNIYMRCAKLTVDYIQRVVWECDVKEILPCEGLLRNLEIMRGITDMANTTRAQDIVKATALNFEIRQHANKWQGLLTELRQYLPDDTPNHTYQFTLE